MTGATSARLSILLAVTIAGCLLGVTVAPALVAAGDNAATFQFDPHEVEAAPGETVTLDLVASTRGGHGGEGLGELSLALEYDADVLTVTDVEHGPMLAEGDDGADVDGSIDVDDESGTVAIEQERDPAADGAIGTEPAATITLEVAEDAPSTSTALEIADAEATLVSGYPQASIERDATVTVEGDSEPTDAGDDSVPGFVPAVALAGIAAVLFVLSRR